MPATSIAQRRLMAAAEHGAQFPLAQKVRQSMTMPQLHDFAATSERGLPRYVGRYAAGGMVPSQSYYSGGGEVTMSQHGQPPIHFQRGALHRQLGVPEGQPIPPAKKRAALAGADGPLAKKRATFAFKGALAAGRQTRRAGYATGGSVDAGDDEFPGEAQTDAHEAQEPAEPPARPRGGAMKTRGRTPMKKAVPKTSMGRRQRVAAFEAAHGDDEI